MFMLTQISSEPLDVFAQSMVNGGGFTTRLCQASVLMMRHAYFVPLRPPDAILGFTRPGYGGERAEVERRLTGSWFGDLLDRVATLPGLRLASCREGLTSSTYCARPAGTGTGFD